MRRVYFIWFVRQVIKMFNRATVRLLALGAMFLGLQSYISFRSVFVNAGTADFGFSADYYFWLNAFSRTEATAKLLIVLSVAVAGWLGWDLIRRARFWFKFKRPVSA